MSGVKTLAEVSTATSASACRSGRKKLAQDHLQNAAVSEVLDFGGRIDSHRRRELVEIHLALSPAPLQFAWAIMPAPMPEIGEASSPVRPNDCAELPGSNCNGRIPMHTRLLR